MARYIDADALYEKLYPLDLVDKRLYTINAKAVADAIAKMPTADVVPKSEVDKLKSDLIVWKQNRFNLYQTLECYEMARQKVAREIFEEIEKYWIESDTLPDCARLVDLDKISELKKKYTEKDFFTPQEVRQMTSKEVRENYQTIMKSMKEW